MSDMDAYDASFADEQVVAGYDPVLIRRVAGYARPHRRLLLGAVLFLIVATVAEVLVPVIIQRAIDHHIFDFWVQIEAEDRALYGRAAEARTVGNSVFVREQALDQLSRLARDQLTAAGRISSDRFVLLEPNAAAADRTLGPPVAADTLWHVYPRDALASLAAEQRAAVRAHNIRGIRQHAWLFLLVLAVALIGGFGQVYLTASAGQRVMQDLRITLFDHTIRQSLGFLNSQPVGRLVTRLTNDVETINELFTSVFAELARNVALMIAVVVTMFSLNARLATFVVASMVPVLLITNVYRRYAREAYRSVRSAVSAVNAYLSEYISGMAIVQLFAQQERSRGEFVAKNDELTHANLGEMYVMATFRPIIDLLSSTSTAVVIYYGARLLSIEVISLGVLIAFTNLVRRFYMPVMSISEQFTILQSAMAGSERVFALLDQNHRIGDGGTTVLTAADTRGAIEFDRVTFAYRGGEPVLRDVSFRVEAGQLVAIVGYTGAGKTTIINLLTRLWDVQSGTIRIDDRPITAIRLDSLRATVQQIQQDVFLFSDTVRNNITLGKELADDAIWAACDAVQIGDYLRSLPAGLETHLEERGTNISAGQRQLIAFARVLAHDPPILVLDEATSSIDSETERKLQHAVETVTGGRTSVVIAHRLSTIQHADKILVLSHGELVESGTHQELLQADGLYASLYRLQYAHQDAH